MAVITDQLRDHGHKQQHDGGTHRDAQPGPLFVAAVSDSDALEEPCRLPRVSGAGSDEPTQLAGKLGGGEAELPGGLHRDRPELVPGAQFCVVALFSELRSEGSGAGVKGCLDQFSVDEC